MVMKVHTRTFALLFITNAAVLAQMGYAPCHLQNYELSSGMHSNSRDDTICAFHDTITINDAQWLRIFFSECNLGTKSYIVMTSLKDQSYQRLNSKSIRQWKNKSAYFNGNSVAIELYVAPGDENIFFRISEVLVGEPVEEGGFEIRSLCGSDDRVASTDPRVGRLIAFLGGGSLGMCTGWIVSNGACLTAGHCIPTDVLEFNVPASNADGTINFANANDQYQVIDTTVISQTDGDGVGNDWAVFECYENPNTGLLPVQAQGYAFYRMSRDHSPTTVRVTGCGYDGTPAGTTGDGNADNYTLQTNAGSFLGEDVQGASDVVIEYLVDTEGGNSGSPVIVEGTTVTIGIHTNGGCNPPSNGNSGTGFENDALENAIHTFPGPVVRYVDKNHPVTFEDGTIFRPYDMVRDAILVVPSGGIISIVPGAYTKASGDTFTAGSDGRAMTIQAPVGTVTIGN